jgi:hypothetical protein
MKITEQPGENAFCMGCGAEGPMRRDKYMRPYWRCYLCGLTIFLRTTMSEAGFRVMQSIIRKMPAQYRKATYILATKLDRERGAAGESRDRKFSAGKSGAAERR